MNRRSAIHDRPYCTLEGAARRRRRRFGRTATNEITHIPYARPVTVPVEVARVPLDSPPPEAAGIAAPGAGPVRRRTDGLAVASAICGFTAIVPFASQVIGLVLGFASLARIRRARREGMELAGARWAYTGIISSGLTLLGWVALFVLMSMLSSSLSQSVESLGSLLPQVP